MSFQTSMLLFFPWHTEGYMNILLCSKEKNNIMFGTTWGWVINDGIFILNGSFNIWGFALYLWMKTDSYSTC